ncbi:anti-adapter protein IraP [Paramixta manurensis]|uniref:Anti-adapter protein IraP n=1 Tax=Paramixta manurensis TaxID=2740817 RepID=A0A6M8U6G8_9GAMM|nr:anti-adapter protein IraP [Erwiniaceae bacterium PD-1]
MKNIILHMLAKISTMDAETKQLTAQVEAQSLLISALMLAISKEGGISEMIGGVTRAINSVLESSDDLIKSDAQLLLTKFQEQIEVTQLIEKFDSDISEKAIEDFVALPDDKENDT